MRRLAVLWLAIAACGGSGGDAGPDAPPSGVGVVFINEAMTSNTTAVADPFGEYDDWIELYNAGDVDIALDGFTLSDDATFPTKAPLSADVVVPAHGFKVIWCDDQVQGVDHVPFKLDTDGEQVALYAPGGAVVDSLTFGAVATDTSLARIPDGTGEFVTCTASTCGTSNGTSCAGAR